MSSPPIDTRSRVLEAAWKLLEAHQGKGVRMSDIARESGISRQAVYLHFATRSELLVATTRYIDERKNVDTRLAQSRAAKTGRERLDAFIEAWGYYLPEIYGVAKALLAMKDSDEDAATAWNDRMQALRHGCEAAVAALEKDGVLAPYLTRDRATDILWTMLSVPSWEQLTVDCGWSVDAYVDTTKAVAHRVLVAISDGETPP